MAIGLGEMLGFHLPKNFDHPYISKTMTEFWRRWHITLGSWFREYVYIPLGGNRKGMIYTIRNLFYRLAINRYLAWCRLSFYALGIGIVYHSFIREICIWKLSKQACMVGTPYMFFLIPLTWAIFAIDDLQQLGVFFTRLFPFFGQECVVDFPL